MRSSAANWPQAAPAARIGPAPGPAYNRAEVTSGGTTAKSVIAASPRSIGYPAAGGRGITRSRNPYLGIGRRIRPTALASGEATPPGPPAAVAGGATSGVAPRAESHGPAAAAAQPGGTDNIPIRPACPNPAAAATPATPAAGAGPPLGNPNNPPNPGNNPALAGIILVRIAFIALMLATEDMIKNCGLNGPPASAPLTTIVLKKLPPKNVPTAELFDPLNAPVSNDDRLDNAEASELPDTAAPLPA